MTDSRMEGIVAGPRLPTLPAVAVQVLRLTESPDATIAQIAEAIEFDQALVVRLLRTVNSSYYGLQRECRGVAQAMSYLGMRAVRSLVLGFSLAKSLDGGGELDIDFPWRPYWRRAVRMAAAARLLATALRGPDPDEAQVVGLVSEIGMVALYRAYGDRYLQVLDAARKSHALLAPGEQRVFEMDHAAVGRLMAARWRFPQEIVDAIGDHERDPDPGQRPLARVASLAALAERAIGDSDLDARATAERTFLRCAEQMLSMPSTRAARLLESIAQRAFELAAILELDVGPAHDSDALVKKARTMRGQGDEGTRGPMDGEESNGFEERIAAIFARPGAGGGAAIAVVEPDGAGTNGLRARRDDVAMSRLRALLSESVGTQATVHALSPTMIVVVVDMPPTTEGERNSMRLVERLRREVETRQVAASAGQPLTVSIGVAMHGRRRFESPDAILRAAMLALGAAQRSGRNRVGHFKPSYDPSAT